MAINNALNLSGTGVVTSDGDGTFTYNTVTEGGVLLGGASNSISDTGVLAKGTLLVGDGAGAPTELAVGTNDQVFTADSTQGSGTKWATASGGGTWVFLNAQTASASATIEWDSTYLTDTYDVYMIVIRDVIPATDGVYLYIRVSDDNGSTFKSGASDYSWATRGRASNGGDTADSEIQMQSTTAWGNASEEIGNAFIRLYQPTDATRNTVIYSELSYLTQASTLNTTLTNGRYNTAADTDAIQFLFSSGNIAQGEFIIYGLKES